MLKITQQRIICPKFNNVYLQLSQLEKSYRHVFRNRSNIYDGAFCKNNSWRLSVVNYFCKISILDLSYGSDCASIKYNQKYKNYVTWNFNCSLSKGLKAWQKMDNVLEIIITHNIEQKCWIFFYFDLVITLDTFSAKWF